MNLGYLLLFVLSISTGAISVCIIYGAIYLCTRLHINLKETIKKQDKELPNNLLTSKEYIWLKILIEPFRDDVEFITKRSRWSGEYYIEIRMNNSLSLIFPDFKDDDKFKMLKENYSYRIKDLDL